MLEFLRPFVVYDSWIYIGLGIVAFIFVRIIWMAQRARSRSIFTLEREKANARATRAFVGLMIILSLILGVYYLSLVTPTIVPPTQNTPTPTQITQVPNTSTPPLLFTATPTPTQTPLPTPTVLFFEENTPTPTVVAQAPPVQSPNCPNENARITRPGNGATVSGAIEIYGTANIDNFDYYKFEFRVPGGDWSFFERYNSSVSNGLLGVWNASVPAGEYEFRLVVVDNIGNFPEPCIVRLMVE